MSKKINSHSTRSSSIIYRYGPGGIFEGVNDTLIIYGLEEWPSHEDNYTEIRDWRLKRKFEIKEIRWPVTRDVRPDKKGLKDLPNVRGITFPKYKWCTGCGLISKTHKAVKKKGVWECSDCTSPVTRSRFVLACTNNHIDEFPYKRWIHRGLPPPGCKKCTVSVTDKESDARDPILKCNVCKKERTLNSTSINKEQIKKLKLKCEGKNQYNKQVNRNCKPVKDKEYRLEFRPTGSGDLWYGRYESSLMIEPHPVLAEEIQNVILSKNYKGLTEKKREDDWVYLIGVEKRDETSSFYKRDDDEILETCRRLYDDKSSNLLEKEYDTMVDNDIWPEAKIRTSGSESELKFDNVQVPSDFKKYFKSVRAVKKCVVNTVLYGFTRLAIPEPLPEGFGTEFKEELKNAKNLTSSDTPEKEAGWLPGHKRSGEGVFFQFERGRISKVNGKNDREYAKLQGSSKRDVKKGNYFMIHSFSHALIRLFANETGFDVSSFGERIYADDKMSGLLVYAAGDGFGGIGGLVEFVKGNHFFDRIISELEKQEQCSNDPSCLEDDGRKNEYCSRSCCYSCLQIPESSCNIINQYLDRRSIIPNSKSSYFFDIGKAAQKRKASKKKAAPKRKRKVP